MKKTGAVLRVAACVPVMLGALVFAAIEGWQLFSGDWRLFEHAYLALGQVIVKLLLCVYCFAIGLWAVLRRSRPFFREGLQLLGVTLTASPFLSNHLGVLPVLFAVLFLLSQPQTWGLFPGRQRKAGK